MLDPATLANFNQLPMFRASIILKNAREDKDLTLEEVSKKLKISVKYLRAIEGEKKADFPAEPYCSLIIKDYANFLGLNGEDLNSLFRRDFASDVKSTTSNVSKMSITPQYTFKVAVVLIIIFFLSYLVNEYIKFNRPPVLKVDWPDSATTIEVTGKTDPESTVRVNSDLIIVDTEGKFHKTISLDKNGTKIVVESKSPSGKTTTVEKTYK